MLEGFGVWGFYFLNGREKMGERERRQRVKEKSVVLSELMLLLWVWERVFWWSSFTVESWVID